MGIEAWNNFKAIDPSPSPGKNYPPGNLEEA